MIKKYDFIVFGSIIAVSLALFFLLFGNGGKTVTVTADGETYGKYSLLQNQMVEIKTHEGTNTLVIENGQAHFINSDCPDKTCQKIGKISKSGETIVCLPHKVIAEVKE